MNIKYLEDKKIWILETLNSSYSFYYDDERDLLTNIHWGEKFPFSEDHQDIYKIKEVNSFDSIENITREEFAPWGGARFKECALKAKFKNGDRNLELEFVSTEIKDEKVEIILKDKLFDFFVKLIYKVKYEYDIIERWVEIENKEKQEIIIENIYSATLNIPFQEEYRTTYTTGHWLGESRIERSILKKGKFILESRRGSTSHYYNPYFAVDNGKSTEEYGSVYTGMLAWSGNWKTVFEKDNLNRLQILSGINDFDFEYKLESDEVFKTPKMILNYSNNGFGGASRSLHKYQRDCILKNKNIRPVLYNSWEATYFDVKVDEQMKLADKAAKLGVELFVLDDGWFGNRNSDSAGLGDWYVNKNKFPNGLNQLIEHVKNLGMKFGIWIEPEMVNKDSDLYRNNPEWIYSFEGRKKTELRNQLVLNFGKKEVQEYILDKLYNLLDNNDISFIKWDMNRAFSELGWHEIEKDKQKEVWVRHVEGIYFVMDKLKERYPDILLESCSGGGGRIDLGVMERSDQFWTSDNTDPYDRLFIQEGFSLGYTAKSMMCWVTDSPNFVNNRKTSYKYRFHSSMMGSLGIGVNLNKVPEIEMQEMKKYIDDYKSMREIIQHGDQFRLISTELGEWTAVQYMNYEKTDGYLFIFLRSQKFGIGEKIIKLQGLNDIDKYNIEGCRTASGKALKECGLVVKLQGDFDSEILKITKI